MNQGVSLLDEALRLARQELTALEDGAFDKAVTFAERRSEVTSMAWQMLEEGHSEQYRERLVELAHMQEHLTELATNAHENIRSQLQHSRRERRRMQGYHQAVSQALQ